MKAPNPSNSILPSAAAAHHSRSIPHAGYGEELFQFTHYGKYSILLGNDRLLPDVSGFQVKHRDLPQEPRWIDL